MTPSKVLVLAWWCEKEVDGSNFVFVDADLLHLAPNR